MAEQVAVEELAESMYKLVKEYAGKKRFTPINLVKEMALKYGADRVSKEDSKVAIRLLIDSGRCAYSYSGGTYIVLAEK